MNPLSSFSTSLAKLSHHAGKISAPPGSVFMISVIWGISFAFEKLQDEISEYNAKKKILEACAVFSLSVLVGLVAEVALYRIQN